MDCWNTAILLLHLAAKEAWMSINPVAPYCRPLADRLKLKSRGWAARGKRGR